MSPRRPAGPGRRILVVEDEPLVAEEIQDRLTRLGYDVLGIVDTGPAAIEAAERLRPDLVLMDIRIKGEMDGIEAAERISRQASIPVVYLTAHSDHATLQRAKHTAQFGYLLKPFKERDLKVAIDLALHRHGLERHLQDSQLSYATILTSITDGVIATDDEGCVRFLNPVAEALTGWPIAAAHGLPVDLIFTLVDRQTREPAEALVARALSESANVVPPEPLLLINREGRDALIDASVAPVRDAAGVVAGTVIVFRDVTERQRAEVALMDARGFLQQVMDTSPIMIFAVDAEGRATFANRYAAEYYGMTPEQLLAHSTGEVHPNPAEASTYVSDDLEVIRRRIRIDKEELNTAPDGQQHWFHTIKVPLVRSDGRVDALGIAVDITAVKRAEAERARLEDQLSQAQKMEALGTLAGGIAHDFNNMLGVMLGNVELAEEDVGPQHPAQLSLREIHRACHRARDLVGQILAFSRRQPLTRVVLDLRRVVLDSLGMLRAAIPAGVEITTFFAPELSSVCADRNQLHQVLMNLCTNAWQALAGRTGRIDIRVEPIRIDAGTGGAAPDLPPGPYVRLSVSDNGKGMDAATAARVFDPFFTTKGPGEGTGLGLAVVHGIMLAHDGAVDLDARPEGGATFRLYFPAVDASIEAAVVERSQLTRGDGQLILYLDDEQSLVSLVARMFERLGYRVAGFSVPRVALEAFRADPLRYAVAIVDYNMPGASGLEVAEELLRLRPAMPIALTSGYVTEELHVRAHALGIRDIVFKPYSAEEMGRVVQGLLRGTLAGAEPAG